MGKALLKWPRYLLQDQDRPDQAADAAVARDNRGIPNPQATVAAAALRPAEATTAAASSRVVPPEAAAEVAEAHRAIAVAAEGDGEALRLRCPRTWRRHSALPRHLWRQLKSAKKESCGNKRVEFRAQTLSNLFQRYG